MPKYSINEDHDLEVVGVESSSPFQFYDTISFGEEVLAVDPNEEIPEAASYCVSRAQSKAGIFLIGLEFNFNVAVVAKTKNEFVLFNAGSPNPKSKGFLDFLKYMQEEKSKDAEIFVIEKPLPIQNQECAILLAIELSKALDREVKRLEVPGYSYLCMDATNKIVLLANKVKVIKKENPLEYKEGEGCDIDISRAIPIKKTMTDLAKLHKVGKAKGTFFNKAFWEKHQTQSVAPRAGVL